jgi:multiple sugar transport system ATP-binding protein
MASITLERVSKHYGATRALREVSLDVADGDFLVLLGPSGCGKSTLLRIVAGLIGPTEGRVVIGDRDVTAEPPAARDIAMVFQSYALYPHLSVGRNLGFGLSVRNLPRLEIERRVRAVAEQLRLSELLGRKPRELSGGQRQRVALGRALVREPQVFLMDEPLSNLDAQLRTATRLELASLHRRLGTTFVYVTHDQIEAMTMGTRIAVLNAGRVEQVGTPAEVYDQPATTFVAGFVGAPAMNLVPAVAAGRDGRVHVRAEGIEAPMWSGALEERSVVLGVRPEHLTVGPASPDAPRFAGRIEAVENLGAEEVAFCRVGAALIAMRGTRPLGVAPGQVVTLTAAEPDVHLFDPATTRRLIWKPDTDQVPDVRGAPAGAPGRAGLPT